MENKQRKKLFQAFKAASGIFSSSPSLNLGTRQKMSTAAGSKITNQTCKFVSKKLGAIHKTFFEGK